MSKYRAVCPGVELSLAKLYMLKDSCQSVYQAKNFSPSQTWFKGAATICHEVIDRVEDALIILEEIDRNRVKQNTAKSGEG